MKTHVAYCIWSVISSVSNLNRWSSSLGLFFHVSLERDQWDWNWRLRVRDTPNEIGCDTWPTNCDIWLTNCDIWLRLNDTPNAIGCVHTTTRHQSNWFAWWNISKYTHIHMYTCMYTHNDETWSIFDYICVGIRTYVNLHDAFVLKTCAYTHMHICVRVYTHNSLTCVLSFSNTSIFTMPLFCKHVHTHMSIYVCVCIHTVTRHDPYSFTCALLFLYTSIFTMLLFCMNAHTHIYIYVCVCIHTTTRHHPYSFTCVWSFVDTSIFTMSFFCHCTPKS